MSKSAKPGQEFDVALRQVMLERGVIKQVSPDKYEVIDYDGETIAACFEQASRVTRKP